MPHFPTLSSSLRLAGAALLGLTLAFVRPAGAQEIVGQHAAADVLTGSAAANVPARVTLGDSLRGRSGRLRARIVRPAETDAIRVAPIARLFGDSAFARPFIWTVADSLTEEPFSFITLLPFERKQDGKVGVYRVGRWPAETRRARGEAYQVPVGFIEVTAENQDVRLSTHFRLRDFLTKDQATVWPKALVLDERLIDKLELIVSELRLAGHRAEGLTVMSGFRTPQYNARGTRAGRAPDSRHQYGDAADVFVDADGNGRMDDLNRDGKIDLRDAREFVRIVDRVEAKYPELVGGVGMYRTTPSHGPFVHVDARGERTRWGIN
jgi:uncharacterized protein YcbK (DUF882 family)